jgi:hypothetical protein
MSNLREDGLQSKAASRPLSWLAVIKSAAVVFTGEAHLTEDRLIPASETALRAPGYRLMAEITPQQPLIGPLPVNKVLLQGVTLRPPNSRLSLSSALFPTDELRRLPYWEFAQSGLVQPVLVALSEPPQVRLLKGEDDPLPGEMTLIHRWNTLPAAEQKAAVLADLGKAEHSPVACAAGFELLKGAASDLPALFDTFASLPSCQGQAMQGILENLYLSGTELPEGVLQALAWRLLIGWQKENHPAALSGYLLWFNAYRNQTWSIDDRMKSEVIAQTKRAARARFAVPYAKEWEKQVRNYSSNLLSAKS